MQLCPPARILALLVATLVPAAPLQAADDAVCAAFAEDFAEQVRQALYAAAMLDPVTGEFQREASNARRARQRELRAWMSEQGDRANPSEEDRRNAEEWPWTMANADFIGLSQRERRDFIEAVDTYLRRLEQRFAPSLRTLSADQPELRAHLVTRCRLPVRVETRYFAHRGGMGMGAAYLPGLRVMLLNLSGHAAAPEPFIDALEHELWHHLLPVTDGAKIGEEPLLEGAIEAVAELWSQALREERQARRAEVEYPVTTAYASLLLSVAREDWLAYLAGTIDRDTLSERLRQRGGLAADLGAQLGETFRMPPARVAAMNALLNGWRWREDDGSPLQFARYVAADGMLDRDAVSREFQRDRPFVVDALRAMAVLDLQALLARHHFRALWQRAELPEHLQRNLREVLLYCRDPGDHWLRR